MRDARPRCAETARLLAAALLLGLTSGCAATPPTTDPVEGSPPSALPTSLAATTTGTSVPTGGALAPDPAVSPTAVPPTAAPPPPKLNVIVVTIDALRADHMPWHGYERDVAPHLTQIARESVSYSRAYALSSYTAMSMGGFLAGRYPGELQRSGYFFSAYPEQELFFPELLQKAGVRTLSGHAHFYFEQKAGFAQAFDDYRMVEGLSVDNTTDKNVTSPQHVQLAIEMLSDPSNTAGQFFAWFHFMDPHDVYVKHEGITYGRDGTIDRYDGEIRFTDDHLAKLWSFIDNQPWAGHTALIISSDHGEAFGEHKRSRHGFELWDVLVRVPMIIRVPGAEARTIDTPRSHIDLAPTILELMDVPLDPNFQGTSLVGELRGGEAPVRDVVVDLPRTSDNFRRRALVHGRHKIMAFGDDFRYKLFDVVDDPGELKDLRRNKPLYKEMKERYLERVKTIKDICPKMRHRLKGKRPERDC